MFGFLRDARTLRIERQKKTLDTLWQVDRSSAPFPDEPPIVYQDADRWRLPSEHRKQEYSSMDLTKTGSAEKEILKALKSPVEEFDFDQMPLNDVIAQLNKQYKINILLDGHALETASIDPSTTMVSMSLKGISLRSALRLLLGGLGLTYMIADEVSKITLPRRPRSADHQGLSDGRFGDSS